jgi:dTDP-4-amino-4,6-dideoxygalactose transaminase
MPKEEPLALHGGPKAKQVPFGSGPKHVLDELEALKRVIERGAIQFARGPEVMELREQMKKLYAAKHCITTSSGTAAIHTALGALAIGRGDEVITSPASDMGTYIAILAQNAVPVFADVDPHNSNMTPESIQARITPHTKAILVVHLAGNPCDMPAIMKIARKHKLFVVEDLAQSYLCSVRGKLCGTFGDVGCFSLNDSKHIGAGDGGMLITNDPALADRADLFADKCYDRTGQGRMPFLLGYNYRMNLLAAAVALVQMKGLKRICDRRTRLGDKLSSLIQGLPGVRPHKVLPSARCTYWYYVMFVEESELTCDAQAFAAALRAEGAPASLSTRCAPDFPLFKDRVVSVHACAWTCPFYKGSVNYDMAHFPGLEKCRAGLLRLGLNEHWTDRDVREAAKAVRKVAMHYGK